MPKQDSQERAEPAYRERDRARLERVSSVPGEQTGVPAPAGTPVETSDLGAASCQS